MLPIGIDQINDQNEKNTKSFSNTEEKIDSDEIFSKIDANLPHNMRADYLKMKNGDKISKIREQEILVEIRKIVNVEEENQEN